MANKSKKSKKRIIKDDNKKKISFNVSFLIGVLVILLLGTSYAWYSFTNANIDVAGTTSSWCAGLNVAVTQNKSINTTSGAPVNSYTEAQYSEFTVTNSENGSVSVDLSIINIAMDSKLKNQYFKYALLEGNTVLSEGDFSDVAIGNGATIGLKNDINIPANATKTYKLYIYILNDGQCVVNGDGSMTGNCGTDPSSSNYNTQNDMKDKSFSGVVKATINSDWCGIHSTDVLYDKIAMLSVMDNINSTYVNNTTPGIDFSSISSDTNGKGVYELSSTASNDYPVYYYRGNVEDNHLIFGGYCWRIVRTTDTGGVKLIYNGIPTGGACDKTGDATQIGTSAFNENVDDNAYVGYMYGTAGSSTYNDTHANTNDSTIKGVIDDWYESNFRGYTAYLEDTVFCNDRSLYSGDGIGTNETAYGAFWRIYSNSPNLVCPNDNDKFTVNVNNGNGTLDYPIGLLTVDEAALAGGVMGDSNNDYLLTGEYYWFLSPVQFADVAGGAYVFYANSHNFLSFTDSLSSSYGVRPVVSLIPGTKISGGVGSVENPYIVDARSILESDPIVTLTLDSSGATTHGTTTVYEQSDYFYLDYTLNDRITSNSNPVTIPTKIGHVFEGYYTEENGEGVQVITAGGYLSSNADDANYERVGTLYAKWSMSDYIVTLNANGGIVDPTTMGISFDVAYGTLPTPTRLGYSFDGWYTEESGGTLVTSDTIVSVASDHVLYAHWTPATYTINFDSNLNYVSEADTVLAVLSGRRFLKKNDGGALVGYGYRENGWTSPIVVGLTADSVAFYTSYNGTTTDTSTYSGTLTYNGTTYYYSSTQYAMGGNLTDTSGLGRTKYTGSDMESLARQLLADNETTVTQSINYGVTQNLTANSYTKIGHNFTGWSTSPTGTVAYTNTQSVTNITDAGEITLYAVWEPIEYNVSVNHSVQQDGGNSDTFETLNYNIAYGKIFVPSSVTAPAGLALVGGYTYYSINNDDSLTEIGDGVIGTDSFVVTQRMAVNVWYHSNTYTINYYNNTNYNSVEDTVIAEVNGRRFFKYNDEPALMAYGHTTSGFTGPVLVGLTADSVAYYSSDVDTVHSGTDTFIYNGQTYYYSDGYDWVIGHYEDTSGLTRTKYTGTRGEMAQQLIADNSSTVSQTLNRGVATNLTANSYTKTSHTFVGWSTSPTGSVIYTDGQSVTDLVSGGTINLYAVWEPVDYRLSLDHYYKEANTTNIRFNDENNSNDYINITYGKVYAPTSTETTITPPTGYYPYNYYWYYSYSDGSYENVGNDYIDEGSFIITQKMILNLYYRPYAPTVTFSSNDLLYGMRNVSNVTSQNMTYSINNGTVTVTANQDNGFGKIGVMAYLRTDTTYYFSCNTNGTWGSGTGNDNVEAYLMLNSDPSNYYVRIDSNEDYAFTVPTNGDYYLRLDVNKNGKTYTFSDINVYTIFSTRTIYYDDTYPSLEIPSAYKLGHTFAGFYTAASGGTQVTDSTVMNSTTDHTIYAQWTPSTYTVTMDANGGTHGSYDTSWTATYGSYYNIDSYVPTRSGYTFDGWYSAASGGTKFGGDWLYSANSNRTLYAHWTPKIYTVTLDKTGSTSTGGVACPSVTSNGTAGPIYMKYETGWYSNSGATTAITEITVPTCTGYTFEGYFYINSSGTASQLINASGTITGGNTFFVSNTSPTVYAKWTANSITFNYYSNNGTQTKFVTWTANAGTTTFPNSHWNYTAGTYAQTRTGYTATGYYGTTTSGGTLVGEDESFASYAALCEKYGVDTQTKSTTINIYAQWTPNTLKVYYNANGGTPSNVVVNDVQYYNKVVSSSNSNIVHSTSSSVSTAFYQTYTYNTASDLYNSGSFGLTRSGYTFAGWNTKADGTGTTFDVTTEYTPTTLNSNINTGSVTLTLYAKWDPNIITVNLNKTGNTKTGGVTCPSVTSNGTAGPIYLKFTSGWYSNSSATTKITKITVPTCTGYTFGGYYYINSDNSASQLINASGTITATNTYFAAAGSRTLYAKWTANYVTHTLSTKHYAWTQPGYQFNSGLTNITKYSSTGTTTYTSSTNPTFNTVLGTYSAGTVTGSVLILGSSGEKTTLYNNTVWLKVYAPISSSASGSGLYPGGTYGCGINGISGCGLTAITYNGTTYYPVYYKSS